MKIFLELSIIVVVAQKKIPTGKKLMNEKKKEIGQVRRSLQNITFCPKKNLFRI